MAGPVGSFAGRRGVPEMNWSQAHRMDGETTGADGVVRVLVVDPDAAGHARCHLALRGLRIGRRPMQLLHVRSRAEAADLLELHRDVAVAVIGPALAPVRIGAPDGRPLWTVRLATGPEGPGGQSVDAVVTGPDADGRVLHAAVLAGLRRAEDRTVATADAMG